MKLVAKSGGFEGQFRCGPVARPRVLILLPENASKHDREAMAQERAKRMQLAVSALVQAKLAAKGPEALKLLGNARTQRDFAEVELAIRKTIETEAPKATAAGPVTFRHVVEMWLSGVLYAQHRGVQGLEFKDAASVNQTRGLMNVILPIIGDLPVTAITREDCDRVKSAASARRKKNGDLIASSRVIRYCRAVRQVLGFCVEPLRLIDVVPVSEKWVPSDDDDDRQFQMIYPLEDRKLMLCSTVELDARLYFGILWRCGLRPGEGARLRWRNLAFKIGLLTVEKTKTGKPRSFHPEDDVMRALAAYKPTDAQPDDYVFPRMLGNLSKIVDDVLQPALKAAGLDVDRAALCTNTKESRHMVAHDGRATYITLKGGLGATEAEIMRVTGHETSKEIKTYTRQIGEVAGLVERGLISWFDPLDELLGLKPEPSTGAGGVARGVARIYELPVKKARSGNPARTSQAPFLQSETAKTPEKRPSNSRNRRAVPPETGGVAQAADGLTAAIAAAAAAGKWALADRLTTQLERLTAEAEVVGG